MSFECLMGERMLIRYKGWTVYEVLVRAVSPSRKWVKLTFVGSGNTFWVQVDDFELVEVLK